MESLILPIVLLVIMIIFGIIFLVISKKREDELSATKKSDTNKKDANSSTAKTSGGNSDIKKEDVFKFMEFDRILDDMIVQNNGSRFTMAIKCKGINYDLMSEIEQLAVEEGFITFLNTLRFPIQLYVQAQNIDLKTAISKYKENITGIKSEFEKLDYQYTKTVEAFDSTSEEIEKAERERNEVLNVYEYAADIINYVERMSYNKNLLQRNFYVLVSYNTSEISAADRFKKEELINICYNELLTRCQNIISGLASCSVEGRTLNSNELADLIYTAYNRDDKSLLSVKEAIDSGFYRLYSTAEDAFIKKRKMIKDEIENEAKIKALVALKDAIEKDEYMSPKIETIVNQEDISRRASEMVAREGSVSEDIKKVAQDRIINDYKNVKRTLLEQVEQEKKEIIEQASKVEGSVKVDTSINQNIEENYKVNELENNIESNIENNAINNSVNNVIENEQINQYTPEVGITNNYNYNVEDTIVEKVNPSELVKQRTEEDRRENENIVSQEILTGENDELIFGDDRLGGNSDTNEEDDIII